MLKILSAQRVDVEAARRPMTKKQWLRYGERHMPPDMRRTSIESYLDGHEERDTPRERSH